MIFLLFKLYTKFNPPHTYNKEQVSGMIDQTDFKEYWIEEKGKEIRVQLKKWMTKIMGFQEWNMSCRQPFFAFEHGESFGGEHVFLEAISHNHYFNGSR